MTQRRIGRVAFARVGVVVAVLLTGAVSQATAQAPVTSASGERVIRRLGGSTRFAPPVNTVDALRRMASQPANQQDMTRVLTEVGLSAVAPQVLEALTSGKVTETTFPVDGHLEWMILREKGQATVARNVRWGGPKPFPAFQFTVEDGGVAYSFIVPKACANLSLVSAMPVARAAAPAAPPPPPPPPPKPNPGGV